MALGFYININIVSSGVVDAKHRAGSLETLLDSAGIWHASQCFRCLSVSSEKKAEYRARVVVDDDDEKRRTRRRRRRIDVVFSCA